MSQCIYYQNFLAKGPPTAMLHIFLRNLRSHTSFLIHFIFNTLFVVLAVTNTEAQDFTLPYIFMDQEDNTTHDPLTEPLTQDTSFDSYLGSDLEFLNAIDPMVWYAKLR